MRLQGIVLIVLCLNFSPLNEQNIKIKGVQKNCQNQEIDWRERYIKLLKGTKVIRDSIEIKDGKFLIKNLKRGNYNIEFTNIFGQIIHKEITANKLKTKIEICIDTFKDDGEETFIQKISNENKLQLNFMSFGCEHWKTEKIIFFQIGSDFFGEFIEDTKSPIKKKLNKEQMQYLIIFERKLRQMKNSMGGCTTEDIYHLILENEELKIADESCDWNGYFKMKKEIFGLD